MNEGVSLVNEGQNPTNSHIRCIIRIFILFERIRGGIYLRIFVGSKEFVVAVLNHTMIHTQERTMKTRNKKQRIGGDNENSMSGGILEVPRKVDQK